MSKEWIVLITVSPGEEFGHWPKERPIEVLLNYALAVIDKPMGPSSHQITTWIRKMLDVKTTGHIGTLDPRVTGVLPVLLGEGVKITPLLQASTKEYVGIMRLHRDVDRKRLEGVINEFRERIYQTPPLRSAVKRALRERTIYQLDLLEYDDRDALVKVRCEGGTYIRRLMHDMGLVLGVGANMQELRRTESAGFREQESFTLHDLKDAYDEWKETGEEKWLREIVHPIEEGLKDVPTVYIKDSAVNAICHGAPLTLPGITQVQRTLEAGEEVAILTTKGELVALGKAVISAREIARLVLEENVRTGIAVKPFRVVMERDLYPKMWGKD